MENKLKLLLTRQGTAVHNRGWSQHQQTGSLNERLKQCKSIRQECKELVAPRRKKQVVVSARQSPKAMFQWVVIAKLFRNSGYGTSDCSQKPIRPNHGRRGGKPSLDSHTWKYNPYEIASPSQNIINLFIYLHSFFIIWLTVVSGSLI